MDLSIAEFESLAAGLESLAIFASVVAGGAWGTYRFILRQERYPNINFNSAIEIVGRHGDHLIVELIAVIENKGKAPHEMSELEFELDALFKDDGVAADERWGGRVNFPHRIKHGTYLPEHITQFIVEPGSTATYSHITDVPADASYLMLHSSCRVVARGSTMHSEKTVRVPATNDES